MQKEMPEEIYLFLNAVRRPEANGDIEVVSDITRMDTERLGE